MTPPGRIIMIDQSNAIIFFYLTLLEFIVSCANLGSPYVKVIYFIQSIVYKPCTSHPPHSL
jgi:hypothetical protein